MNSPIDNGCLRLYLYGQAEPQLVTKLLLQVSARELHNNMVRPTEEVGPKE